MMRAMMPRQLFELKLKCVATHAKRGFENLRCFGLPHSSKIQALFFVPLLNKGVEVILSVAEELLTLTDVDHQPVRLLGLSLSNLEGESLEVPEYVQLSLALEPC